MGEARR